MMTPGLIPDEILDFFRRADIGPGPDLSGRTPKRDQVRVHLPRQGDSLGCGLQVELVGAPCGVPGAERVEFDLWCVARIGRFQGDSSGVISAVDLEGDPTQCRASRTAKSE